MDIDEPIQALLKSTGWTCEDLLEKLQKYKAKNKPGNVSTDTQPVDSSKNEETDKKYLQKETDDTSDSGNIETFSDTDEEKTEMKVINNHTTNEIKEVIPRTEEVKLKDTDSKEGSVNEITEVTEVRVVEINEDDEEDDNFEETVSSPICSERYIRKCSSNEETTHGERQQENDREIKPLERINRKKSYSDNTSFIEISSDESDGDTNKIEYVETYPRKKIKLEYNSGITNCKEITVNEEMSVSDVENKICENKSSRKNSEYNETSDQIMLSSNKYGSDNSENPSTEKQVITFQKDYHNTFLNFIETKEKKKSRPIQPKKYFPVVKKSIKNMGQVEMQLVTDKTTKESNVEVLEKSPWKFLPNVLKYCKPLSPKSVTGRSILKIRKLSPQSVLKNKQAQQTDGPSTTENKNIPSTPEVPGNNVSGTDEMILKDSKDQLKDGEDDSNSDEGAPIENLEDIRNNLKLQLNCLRTRKKEHILQPLTTKVVEHVECSEKLSNILSSDKTKETHDLKPDKTISGDNTIFTQTNELGLVILDVQGGVNLDTTPSNETGGDKFNEQTSDTVADDEEDAVQNGLLDQIRKIIRKQKSPRKPKEFCSPNLRGNSIFFQSSTPKSEAVIQEKPSMEIISNENSQSSFTNDHNDSLIEKSPFISDTLDEFLGGASKLNISYKVPQSGAEAGLKEKFIDESPLVLKKVVEIKDKKEIPKKISLVKAKTVAQKRKFLERQQLNAMRKKERLTNIQKNKEINVCAPKVKVEGEKEKKTVKVHVNKSYVLCQDNKLWVKTTCPSKCIAKIGQGKIGIDDSLTPRSKRLKRISLLEQCKKNNVFKPQYRPGPLCRKNELQVTGKVEWESETKRLPTIVLELSPVRGQKFPDDICSRMSRLDGNLDSNRIEFALSMLKHTDDRQTCSSKHGFALNYTNKQESILVRKKRVPAIFPCKYEDSYLKIEKNCSEDVVSDVIEDLLRYVEIKELAPSLIQEDGEAVVKQEDVSVEQLSPINSNVSIFKKPQKKRSRFEFELQRLSCKVVNVEVEEVPEEDNCKKPYCQLGCICRSLKCEGVFSNHCRLVKCMFGCSCPQKERIYEYDHTLTLPAGTDLLSHDAVTRIEDEAKKNMAKVEREFTQTVIQTNDKTIVVGLGGRNKSRRNAKAPVKYSDYVDNVETLKHKFSTEVNMTNNCVVSLANLNLSEIIPYCLAHNLYNCHCKGKSNWYPVVPKRAAHSLNDSKRGLRHKSLKDYYSELVNEEIADSEDKIPYTFVPKYCKKEEKERKMNVRSTRITNNRSETIISEDSRSETGSVTSHADETSEPLMKRSTRNKKKKELDEDFIDSNELNFNSSGCSRVKEIPAKYLRRIVYNDKIFHYDFINNFSDSDMLQAKINASKKDQELLEVDLLKQQLLENHLANRKNTIKQVGKNKRKQILKVRQDLIAPKSNESSEVDQMTIRTLSSPHTSEIKPVFEGEVIINKSNMELLSKMGPKTLQDGYARLLPWKSLTESFRQGKINIWSMVDQPSRLLLNRSDKKAPKNYVDIKESQQTTEVILWILRNKLPANYEENSVSFILKETKDNFEICGVCTKNFSLEQDFHHVKEPPVEKLGITNNEQQFVHKDLNADIQILQVYQKIFKLQELVEECASNDTDTSVDKTKLYMWAALPEIYRVCKWRVIYLNSDFSYLHFTNIKYSIRYTDLLTVGKVAKARKRTIVLRNDLLHSNYEHIEFGIYFDPHYIDRVFIGPYFKHFQGFDVETLRYINKDLVSTESFNKMRGTADYKCGHWLVERPYLHSKTKKLLQQAELQSRAVNDAQPNPLQSLVTTSEDDSPLGVQEHNKITNSKGEGFTIDLTRENDDKVEETEKKIQPRRYLRRKVAKPKGKAKPCMIIMHNAEEIQIVDAPPRNPEEFNRYIFTNIPNFGYLGAYRYALGKIDVSWPFENKLLRFPSSDVAIDFLQERFSALLQPVPDTFTIKLSISSEIDVTTNKPIDSNALNGHFVCGEFGFYNISTMKDQQCQEKLGMSRQEILKMFARRAQVFVKKRVDHLAKLLKIDKDDNGCFQIENILDSATEEIRSLTEKDINNVLLKNELLVKKRDKAVKVFGLISQLPNEQRNLESLKFRWILNKTMPIEIQDSDEDSKELFIENKKHVNEGRSRSPIIKVLEPQECLRSLIQAKSGMDPLTEPPRSIEQVATTSRSPSKLKSVLKPVLKPLIRVSKSLYPPPPKLSPNLNRKMVIKRSRNFRMIAPKPMMPKLIPKNYTDRGVKLANVMKTVKIVQVVGDVSPKGEVNYGAADGASSVVVEKREKSNTEDVSDIKIHEVFSLEDDFVIEKELGSSVSSGSNDKMTDEVVITRITDDHTGYSMEQTDEDKPKLENVQEFVSETKKSTGNNKGNEIPVKTPFIEPHLDIVKRVVKTYARKSVDKNLLQNVCDEIEK